MRSNAIGGWNRWNRSRYTQSGRNRNVVARGRFTQVRVVEALAASKPFIRIVPEKITNAIHQSDGNGFVKECMYVPRTDLYTVE